MKSYSWDEILKRIEEDQEINFVAEAMTPLHVLGIEALILHLENSGIKCKGYILAMSHAKTGNGLTDSMFHTNCYENVEPVLFDGASKKEKTIRFYRHLRKRYGGGEAFYYATPLKPSFDRIPSVMVKRPYASLHVYVTEEGAGNYTANPYSLCYNLMENKGLYNQARAIWDGAIKERIYKSYLEKAGCLLSFLLLDKKAGKLIPNSECAKAYRILLESEVNDSDFSKFEDSIVFAPSLLYESGIVSKRCDVDEYKIIQKLLGDGNYVLKPHPREKSLSDYEVLKCQIELNNRNSIESIVSHLKKKPRYVIGDSGTALYNLAILFGVKTISINKLIDRRYLIIKDYFDSFNRLFGNIVFIPETKEELEDYLCKDRRL